MTKSESAASIARKLPLHPEGITSGELFDRYHTLFDLDPPIIRREGVDHIQKALNRLKSEGLVTIQERTASRRRTYFPTQTLEDTVMPATNNAERLKFDSTNPENVAVYLGLTPDNTPTLGVKPVAPQPPAESPEDEPTDLSISLPIPSQFTLDERLTYSVALLNSVSKFLAELPGLQAATATAPTLPDADKVVNDIYLTADMLRMIRPDLAASLDAAHQYILATAGNGHA